MKKSEETKVTISAPNIRTAQFGIVGTAPYVQLCFSEKQRNKMLDKMKKGTQPGKREAKEPRDVGADFENAKHTSTEGWVGMPAAAFRNAMISACRLVGYKMTIAKMSVFIQADGFDKDGYALVKIEGEPEHVEHHVRNATGVADVRVRAKFWPWKAQLRVNYDADQFTLEDVTNLLSRVGAQVGIGEGRPDSKNSAGMGWGTFELERA